MRYQVPRGTHDILPTDIDEWLVIEKEFRNVCARYGYREIRTPEFEATDLFVRTAGETSDIVTKQMYSFTDQGGNSFTLRPEGTAPIVRAFLEHTLSHGIPLRKLCYVGVPVFRWERPQAGRYRIHHQCGIEAIGSSDPALDAEIITLGVDFLKAIDINDFSIHLNAIGCPECRPAYRNELVAQLGTVRDELCSDCQRRLDVNPLRVLDCKNERCNELTHESPGPAKFLCRECLTHFADVKKLLDLIGIQYRLDDRLVRGLDYYTKTAFEFLHGELGAQNAVLGGGRYDGLVESCGGDATPGIGFGSGIERLVLVRRESGNSTPSTSPTDVFVSTIGEGTKQTALQLLYNLRRAGVGADTDYFERGLRAQMRFADSLEAKIVIIVGADELARGTVQLRELMQRDQPGDTTQQEVPLEHIVDEIKRRLS